MTLTPPPSGNGRGRSGLTATMSSDVGAAPRRGPTIGTALIALGVIVALNLIIVAFVMASREVSGPPIPVAFQQIFPVRNGQVPRQDSVGADLQDDYTGVIIIDDKEIPEDQLFRIVPQGVVRFQPGPGKDIESFEPGRHSIKVVYWKQIESRETAHEYGWQFNVQ